MKKEVLKTLFVLPVLLFGISLMSFVSGDEQKTVYVGNETYDFGAIGEANGKVNATFVIHNDSDKAVSLVSVSASCGCTTPTWNREPIAPGSKSEIAVSFDPKGRKGSVSKRVTAKTDSGETIIMYIKGIVN